MRVMQVAMVFDGHGVVQDNIMWGNLHRSTIDVGADTLTAAQVPALCACSFTCACCTLLILRDSLKFMPYRSRRIR